MSSKTAIMIHKGTLFNVTEPSPEEVDIETFTYALSNNCRFNGHTDIHWSVAQHSLLVADIIRELYQGVSYEKHMQAILLGLLHDASEGYISDISKPFKQVLTQYLSVEEKVQNAIHIACGIDYSKVADEVKNMVVTADELALVVEARNLIGNRNAWGNIIDIEDYRADSFEDRIRLENPQIVQGKLIERIYKLTTELGLKTTAFNQIGTEWAACDGTPVFIGGKCKMKVLLDDTDSDRYILIIPSTNETIEVDRNMVDMSQNIVSALRYARKAAEVT